LQFIVCHSHGGNIALALHDPEVRRVVTGVVCLATPFVNVRLRNIGESSMDAAMLAGIVAGTAVLVGCLAATGPSVDLLGFTFVMLLSLTLAGAVLMLVPMLWASWRKGAARLVERFAVPRLDSSRLMIVRVSGDEASAALGSVSSMRGLRCSSGYRSRQRRNGRPNMPSGNSVCTGLALPSRDW
jgi:hypothetical protein